MAPTRRPEGRPIGYQSWHSLLFLHWSLPVEVLRPLIPDSLSIDTFGGRAWIGLVPFTMRNVRPRWFCSVPGVSNFHETNVRTYVVHQGEPGVWFFSLDAANSLAVRIARWRWNLNYFRAAMDVETSAQAIHYTSRRLWPGRSGASTDILARFIDRRPENAAACRTADPGSFEHFLLERYLLYTIDARQRLLRGQVHHTPYPWVPIEPEAVSIEENLTAAAGLSVTGPAEHAAYSPGVNVEIFPLTQTGPLL